MAEKRGINHTTQVQGPEKCYSSTVFSLRLKRFHRTENGISSPKMMRHHLRAEISQGRVGDFRGCSTQTHQPVAQGLHRGKTKVCDS